MNDAYLSLALLGVVVVLFVTNALPVEVIAVGAALALYFTGILTLPEALAGFSDPAVLLIASLFVVSEGLDATGVTTWLGQKLVAMSGSSTKRMLLFTMVLSALMTALIGLNGTVAALLPMAVVMALRQRFPTSQLLMPMVFAGSAGSLLLLTGTPVNVIISEASAQAGVGAFGFAEFALAGIPLVIGTVAIVMLLGSRLLPHRNSSDLPPDLSGQASTLVGHYCLDDIFHVSIPAGSGFAGRERDHWDVVGIRLVAVLDAESRRPVTRGTFEVGDRLTLVGAAAEVAEFADSHGLLVEGMRDRAEVEQELLSRESGAAEVVVPPRSRFIGKNVRPGQVVADGALTVVAIQRQGRDLGSLPVDLSTGDVLLVEGDWLELERGTGDRDLLVVDSPDLVRRQAVPMGQRSSVAIAVTAAMVVLLVTGFIPAAVAAMLAAMAMVVLRVVNVQQAYRAISWTTVLLIAGMMPMSTAITKSGAGGMIAEKLVDLVGGRGPTLLLVALFGLSVVFGQLISNTATALVVIPIAVSAAAQMDISARPVLMSVCVASAAAFLTPVATPPNMMVMGPGAYKFGDYWKLGLPLVVWFFVISVGLVPLIWRF